MSRVEELATKKGVTMAQLSLAWLLHKEGVTAPIVGPSSVEKLKDLLGEWYRASDLAQLSLTGGVTLKGASRLYSATKNCAT